jgi:chromosome segregation ATPase
VQSANDALKRAKDELSALDAYRAELGTQLAKAKDSLDYCAMNLRDKRAAVLRDSEEVAGLLERYETTRRAYHQMEITLQRISSVDGIPPAHYSADLRHLKPDPAWMTAIEALLTDANAMLPD